ncbi:MAG: YfdX family protein [Gammaproteobacteria bacterium]|nr:YfdX family protein [Gammaproteobacteria bacterium]
MLALTPVAFAQSDTSAEGVAETTKAVQAEVQAEANIQTEERVDDALEALAVATGKLELIVARNPELALAATDVSITTHDIFASAEAIRAALKSAKKALDMSSFTRSSIKLKPKPGTAIPVKASLKNWRNP